jgi:hypothetical protein
MSHLEKQLATELGGSWESICPPGRKAASKAAEQVALRPFANAGGVETAAHAIVAATGGAHRELPTGPAVLRAAAVADAPELRIVARSRRRRWRERTSNARRRTGAAAGKR